MMTSYIKEGIQEAIAGSRQYAQALQSWRVVQLEAAQVG